MKTLYLRNVPDDVAAGLEALARRESMSTSSLAVRELAAAVRFRENARLFEALPDRGLAVEDIVAAVRDGRDR